jgi:hypothetical protein
VNRNATGYFYWTGDSMRVLIVVAVLLLICGLVGWVQYSSSDGNPTIHVDTEKVKQDTASIIEKSKQAIDGATEKKMEHNIDPQTVTE